MDKLIWLYPYVDTIKIDSGKELFHHYRIMETSHSLKALKPPLHITMQSPSSVRTLYLAHVIEQPNFRIPNPQYLQRNFCYDFFNDSENTF